MYQHEIERRIAVLVHIAEPLLSTGVRAALADESDIEVIDAAPIHVNQNVDVVVTDISTAAEIAEDGRRFAFGSQVQPARILVVAPHTREYAVRIALQRGIHAFVLTSSPVHELMTAVRVLARGGNYVCPTAAHQFSQFAERDMLTSREGEVLRLLATGLCNKSIARDLDIAVGTVKVHVKSIMSKLNASSRTEAASIATEHGLVDVFGASCRRVKHHATPTARLGFLVHQPFYA